MRRGNIIVPVLAVWLTVPDVANARNPINAILGVPHALLGGLFGHHGRHGRHHDGHGDARTHRMARAVVPDSATAARSTPGDTHGEATAEHPAGAHVGWVGPIFWPHAADDILNDALLPDARGRFWDHGYADIIDAILGPAAAHDATRTSRKPPGTDSASPCSAAETASDGLADRVKQTVQATDAQQSAVVGLRTAAAAAIERMKMACPSDAPRTPTGRLHAMVQRLRTMDQVASQLRAPVATFYDALTDEQKARLNDPGQQANRSCKTDSEGATATVTQTLQQAVQPADSQRMGFAVLMGTVAKMADMLRACPEDRPATPMARLDAARERIGAMLFATQIIHTALYRWYFSLSDDQKARFNAIGDRHEQAAR